MEDPQAKTQIELVQSSLLLLEGLTLNDNTITAVAVLYRFLDAEIKLLDVVGEWGKMQDNSEASA